MACSARIPAGVIILCSLAAFCASGLAAEGRRVPVLEKRKGGFRHTGRLAELPAGASTGWRIFGFDKFSVEGLRRTREGSGRRMLLGPSAPPESWHVALVRVSFETDRSGGLTSIATGGGFDLTPGGGSIIDPTPHNRSYFDSHMDAMARYYHFQSCGAVEITWDILPEGEEGSYRLSDPADYGPGGSGQWTTQMLVDFVHDAVIACDDSLRAEGYQARLSDYDAIVLAHAGANLQSDVMQNSPNDIPSFYARLGDGDEILVENGGYVITELSVIPETAIQDGYVGGIAAVLAHEFGHQLGLPDLYDTYTNQASIGVFDNMDSGGQLGAILVDEEGGEHYAEGFMPSGLGAWSRYLLGWMEVDTIGVFEEIVSLPASEKCPPRGVRVEMSADEYWLIENRAAELDGLYTGFVTDEATGVILGPGNCMNCGAGFPDDIEWEFTNGYDYLLPTESPQPGPDWGPGILVWHVDEYFIERRWDANEVNSRWPFGVSLVEASGVVDLGDPTSRYGLGWFDDAFYEGNAVEMNDSTLPPAWSNWQVQSGLSLEGVSGRDTLMTFAAGCRERSGSKLVDAPEIPARFGLLPVGEQETIMIDEAGYGYLAGIRDPVIDIYGGAATEDRGTPLTPCALAPGFGGCGEPGEGAVILADEGGAIHAFSARDWTECPSWPVYLDSLSTFPVVLRTAAGTMVAAAERRGALRLIGSDGELSGSPRYPEEGYRYAGNLVAEKDDDDEAVSLFVLAAGEGGGALLYRYLVDSGEPVPDTGYPITIPLEAEDTTGEVFLTGGDIIPGESGSEVWIAASKTGRLLLAGGSGIIGGRLITGGIAHPPALQDLSGDGRPDLICTDGKTIYAIDPSGANVTGWPRNINGVYILPVELSVTVPPVAAANAGGAWVLAGTDAGILFIFDRSGNLVPGWPRKTACAHIEPLDLSAGTAEGEISWYDLVFNSGESSFGEWRPAGGRARWQRTPFGVFDAASAWSSVYGGTDRDSYVLSSSGFELIRPQWADLDDNLVIYPNPSPGDMVFFNFAAPENGEARLGVMTLEGEKVAQMSMPLMGGQAEFAVSMAGRASGVYLCRLVISSGGRTVETTRKFAIVN
jgi:M6 family metalloprotease-like protein